MVADYFVIRRKQLDLESLYMRNGIYEYRSGINPRAIAALVVGVGLVLIGRFVPSLHWLYDYAWFVGFFVSGGIYTVLMRGATVHAPEPSLAGEKA
jgi:NCS1 family nucleobase:cation symporter-1